MSLTTINTDIVVFSEKLNSNLSFSDIFQLLKDDNYSVLLQSSLLSNHKTSRYSFIPVMPESLISLKNYKVSIQNLLNSDEEDKIIDISSAEEVFNILNKIVSKYKDDYKELNTDLPFSGGLIGYFSYDFVRYIEKIPKINSLTSTPDFELILARNAVIIDHIDNMVHIIAVNKDILNTIKSKIYSNKIIATANVNYKTLKTYKDSFSKDKFIETVDIIKEYISAGEIYQANISIQIKKLLQIDPFKLYKLLYQLNPSPFCSYIHFGDRRIICNSPERLIKCNHQNLAETRPIAGTRARGKTNDDDERLTQELVKSAKERSEHIMLVDLERNDLGKVSKFGSVRVDELFSIEKYSHVMHIVSNVKSILNEKSNTFDLFKSVFPGGTITGVPKIRCMEIIEEVEPVRRGIYTGSIGYFDFRGNMDFNIIIRTMELEKQQDHTFLAKMQFGAGIVADSVGEFEYKECMKKGNALFEALKKLNCLY